MRPLLLVLLLTGCIPVQVPAPGPTPVYAFNARPLIAEGWYRAVHAQMEACLGERRSFDAIEWFRVQAGFIGMHGETRDSTVAGAWSWPSRIYLDARVVWDEGTLKHEVGHYLKQKGDELHDDPLFKMCTSV